MAENDDNLTDRMKTAIDIFSGLASANTESSLAKLADSLPGHTSLVLDTLANWLGKMEAGQWQAMLDYFVSIEVIDKSSADVLYQLKDQTFPLDTIFYFYLFFSLSMGHASLTMASASGKLQQRLNKEHSPMTPYHTEVLQAAFTAPEKTGEVRDAMRRSGISDDDIDLLFLAAYRLYTEGDIRTLWLRGVLSEDQMFMRMRELGYTDTRIKELVQGWEALPGTGDLITMAYRGSFDPANRAQWPWAFEAPGVFVAEGAKQGITKEWAEKYWYMHWTQPGVREMFEMMHRGTLDEAELDHTLKVQGYSDYWIPKLKTITYNPYTRVDVRRMHKIGVLDDEQLLQAYKDLGFDEEKAANMVQFTIEYNLGSEKSMTRSEIITGYRENLIEHADAIELLVETRYTPEHAEYLLVLEDYKEAKELQDMAIKNIRTRYQNNMLEAFDARGKLGQLNLSAVKIEALINKWELDRVVDTKLFSKSDLQKLYLNKIINEDQWRTEMYKLGYGWQYIDWAWQLMSIKKPIG